MKFNSFIKLVDDQFLEIKPGNILLFEIILSGQPRCRL